jgi:hypothetical protein
MEIVLYNLTRLDGIDHIDDSDIVIKKLYPTVLICLLPGDYKIGHVFWFHRFFYEFHVAFGEELVSLLGVAPFARANLIFPRIRFYEEGMGYFLPAAHRYYMVDSEVFHTVSPAAVLAAHIIPVDNVETGVYHPFSGNFVVIEEHDDTGKRQGQVLRTNPLIIIDLDGLGLFQHLQNDCFTHVAYVDWYHAGVECEYRGIQHGPIITDIEIFLKFFNREERRR